MKNYKVLIIFTLVVTISAVFNQARAQKMQDVIYLKSGSILHGEIIKIEVNKSLTLLSNCGDTWVLNQSEIDRIEKQPAYIKSFKKDSLGNISYKQTGFYSNLNVGFLFGGNMETPFPPLSLRFVSGYQFEMGLGVGVGLGLDLLTEAYMPAVVDLRYTFRNSRVSHYVYLQGGYAISLESPDPYDYDYYYYDSDLKSKGGYLINPGIGFKLNLNDKNAFSFGIGYKYSEIYHTYTEYNGQEIDRTIKYNRITLNFGYHF
ncbi:MAG: hypothetical protein C0597_14435 [Marinilabiliales bacterium]|nr:MAG: hypothetical protein C0597_14435 [Marinilabiliales bacterium]